MATTRIIPMHRNQGRTVLQSLSARTDYVMNPNKTEEGQLIRCYECEAATVDVEFLLAKQQYKAITGREVKEKGDVIAYQLRQSFYPGEITPEQANQLGYELAMKFTEGKHQFVVATHVDKAHVHNHIVFNSTTLDCTHKFNNYKDSADVVRDISDELCLENGLSVVTEPAEKGKHYAEWNAEKTGTSWKKKLKEEIEKAVPLCTSFEQLVNHMEQTGYEIKRGKHISFRAPGQQRFTRMKTLGAGYSEEEIRERILAGSVHKEQKKPVKSDGAGSKQPKRNVEFLIDIQKKLAEGKGGGYAQWAKVFNVKAMAEALMVYEREGFQSMEELDAKVHAVTAEFDATADLLKNTEAQLRETKAMKQHILNYGRTREVYAAYKKSKNPEAFYEEHRADLAMHLAAKKYFDESGLKALPKVKDLTSRIQELMTEQKKQYQKYRETRSEMQNWQAVKQNLDSALGRAEKEKHRGLDR